MHLKTLMKRAQGLKSIEMALDVDPVRISLMEDAVQSLVDEVSVAQASLTEHNSAGLASNKGLVGALSPMVEAVARVKKSTQPRQIVSSFRELKGACRNARKSVSTFENSMLSAIQRYRQPTTLFKFLLNLYSARQTRSKAFVGLSKKYALTFKTVMDL